MDWQKWLDEAVAAEKVAPKLRAEGWFTVRDVMTKTGWNNSKARMFCINQEKNGQIEKQLAPDTNSRGSVVEVAFYRRKNKP